MVDMPTSNVGERMSVVGFKMILGQSLGAMVAGVTVAVRLPEMKFTAKLYSLYSRKCASCSTPATGMDIMATTTSMANEYLVRGLKSISPPLLPSGRRPFGIRLSGLSWSMRAHQRATPGLG